MGQTLQHYGVLGMRWGVRRNRIHSNEHLRSKSLRKKHLSEMTNDELREITNRMQLEQQYRDLKKRQLNPGVKFARDLLVEVGREEAKTYIHKQIPTGINAVKALLGH